MKRDQVATEYIKVSLVTLVCVLVILFVTTQVLHVDFATPALGLAVLYLGYHVSQGWTPLPAASPALFWSLAIILTTLIEILFAYLYPVTGL